MELRDTQEEAAFRQEVREFIAQNLPSSAKARGARRFEDADREWSHKLGAAGYAGPDLAEGVRRRGRAVQPPGDLPRGAGARRGAVAPRRDRARHGGADDHRLGHAGAEGALPLEDPDGRGDLVPGLLGARRRQRPRRLADADRGPGRPLPRQRTEGLVVVRAHRRLLHPRRARAARCAALQEPDLRDRRHARARRRGAAARSDHRPPRVQRDLLHRRQGAEGEHARRGRRRLAGRDDDAAARARHARLRALGDARRRGAQADRSREGAERHRPDPPRPHRARVDRAPGAQVHELPLADDA